MGAIPGSVRVTGIIAPTDSTDTYAVTDTVYGLDGLRNFSGDSSSLSAITVQRRRAGMIAGTVSADTRIYYRLNESPWAYDATDWVQLTLYDYTGATTFTSVESAYWVSGATPTSLKYANSPNSTSNGLYALVAQGESNHAIGTYALVLNGAGNVASGSSNSVVVNGDNNVAHATGASILNGETNIAWGSHSSVLGGVSNIVWNQHGLVHGQNNNVYGAYAQAFGSNNIASGQSQFVVGIYNVPQGVSGSSVLTDYGFIMGAGTNNQRKNAIAVTKEGMIQMNPQTGTTLPSANVADGALAYSSNTGLYQYVNGAWTGFTTGGDSWQQVIDQGNIIVSGSPFLNGEALRFNAGGVTREWEVRADSTSSFIITGDTYGALQYEGKTFDILKENGEYTKIGNESGGLSYIQGWNGTNSGVLNITNNLTGNRIWNLPDQSGVIALVTDLTGNTGGAPQTLDCLNPTTTWNLDQGHNALLVLTADTTISVTNVTAGDYGTLLINQDVIGGHSVTPPGSSVVVNGAGGLLNLTTNASAEDIITFYYTGTKYYWNLGGDYT